MKPFIVAITGAHSGCGKTFIAETVLRGGIGLTCGAVKYTKTPLYASITDDDAVIGEEGTDTARMLAAGARSVQWIQSPEEDLQELIEMALDRLGGYEVIIIEGNSPARIISPDVVIFVFGDDPGIVKESAQSCIEKADYMIYKDKPSIKTDTKMYNKYSDREMGRLIGDLKMRLKQER